MREYDKYNGHDVTYTGIAADLDIADFDEFIDIADFDEFNETDIADFDE